MDQHFWNPVSILNNVFEIFVFNQPASITTRELPGLWSEHKHLDTNRTEPQFIFKGTFFISVYVCEQWINIGEHIHAVKSLHLRQGFYLEICHHRDYIHVMTSNHSYSIWGMRWLPLLYIITIVPFAYCICGALSRLNVTWHKGEVPLCLKGWIWFLSEAMAAAFTTKTETVFWRLFDLFCFFHLFVGALKKTINGWKKVHRVHFDIFFRSLFIPEYY